MEARTVGYGVASRCLYCTVKAVVRYTYSMDAALVRRGPDLGGQNLGNSYVSSQTRRFVPIGVAPSVHGVPHIASETRLVEPAKS